MEFNSPLTPFKIELVNDKIDLIAKSDTIPRIESCSQEIEDEVLILCFISIIFLVELEYKA